MSNQKSSGKVGNKRPRKSIGVPGYVAQEGWMDYQTLPRSVKVALKQLQDRGRG